MEKQNIPTMLSIHDTQKLTGLSYVHIRHLIETGEVKYVKAGKKFLVNLESLIKYLNNEEGDE